MPAPHPPEFRRRAVELARLREQPVAQIAKDLGISESCLRQLDGSADVDEGRKEGLSSDERAELVQLRRRQPGPGDGDRDPQAGHGLLRAGERAPKIGFRLVHELAADGIDVAVACRVLEVSTSGYYEWRDRPPVASGTSTTPIWPTRSSTSTPPRGLPMARRGCTPSCGWAAASGSAASGSPG